MRMVTLAIASWARIGACLPSVLTRERGIVAYALQARGPDRVTASPVIHHDGISCGVDHGDVVAQMVRDYAKGAAQVRRAPARALASAAAAVRAPMVRMLHLQC